MKQFKFFALMLSAILVISTFSGCVSDDSHIARGYGWGTVKMDTDFNPYVFMDDSKEIFIKGSELTSKALPEGQRVFISFVIDYDKQPPMTGSVKAIFATFLNITAFNTNPIEPAGSGASFKDKIYIIYTPWVTYNYDGYGANIITFNTAIFWKDEPSYDFKLTYADDYKAASDTAKFVLSYYKGSDDISNLQSAFHSYYLPSDLKSKCTIQVRFRAENAGNFGMTKDSTVSIQYIKPTTENNQ